MDELYANPTFSARMREVIVLRVANLQGCAYELGQHRDVALESGVSAEQIDAVTTESDWETGYFARTELAVLRLTTELVSTRAGPAVALSESVQTAHGPGTRAWR
ncbi:carboxymuconolactone decarboxylase family protein [Mycobacterium sp. pR1184]|uniref:carboxymuconolactone decarboxylase family protein n=1 Tax=Mycobacterium sp. pR1184 TaxID=3238981 RepID=UPI00351AE5C6